MWRLQLAAGAAVLALVAGLWLWGQGQRDKALKAEARAVAYERQAKVSDATTRAVDQVLHTEVVIRDRTGKAADAVQKAPGADAPVPDAVLSEWRRGIDSLRNPDAGPEGDRPGKPQG